jgi:hypothetical protein
MHAYRAQCIRSKDTVREMIAQGVIMGSAFLSPKEYRDFAAQCLRWAARAKREEHKNMMLQMADHWMQRAHELERTGPLMLRQDDGQQV